VGQSVDRETSIRGSSNQMVFGVGFDLKMTRIDPTVTGPTDMNP